MTDDLVKRLRISHQTSQRKDNPNYNTPYQVIICAEAADRIEELSYALKVANEKCLKITERCVRLDKALQNIADGPREANKSYAELFIEVCGEARDALQPPPIPEKNNDQ